MGKKYPVIDMYKTGQNIKNIMKLRGMTVRDIQNYLELATPQSIYHWFDGRNMPTVDNLYALSELFHVPIDTMICGNRHENFGYYKQPSFERMFIYYRMIGELMAG